ncbi:MAG: hypothetical protein AB1816_00010 [Bacillota bacterium]
MNAETDSGTRVTLVEEVAPAEVVPAEEVEITLWNSPPAVQARYRVAGPPGFRPLQDRGAAFWDEGFLHDCDLFGLPPGWRLFGADAPDRLRAAGYQVDVVTRAEARDLRRRREEEVRAAGEAERRRLEALEREYREWKERVTSGLVETTVAPRFYVMAPEARRTDGWTEVEGVRTRLLAGWPRCSPGPCPFYGEDWYEVVLPDGTRFLARLYGNAALYYAPAEKAAEWYRAQWEEDVRRLGPQGAAAYVRWWLSQYDGCYGSDYYRFVRDEFLGPGR